MLQHYMLFRPAALCSSDIDNGDANVVCLGANAIDPKARHGIELQFDAKKIAENNPCVFYKQRDLGFYPKKIRQVMIGDLDLHFSHTVNDEFRLAGVFSLVLCGSEGERQYARSDVTNATLIADNIKDMHQILTLNFFRFVDRLRKPNLVENTHDKEQIYSALSKLTDEELVETLLDARNVLTGHIF